MLLETKIAIKGIIHPWNYIDEKNEMFTQGRTISPHSKIPVKVQSKSLPETNHTEAFTKA